MALTDYYRCDICNEKSIYDADIYKRWDRAGDMAIICKSCAEKYEVVVVPKNRVHPSTTEGCQHKNRVGEVQGMGNVTHEQCVDCGSDLTQGKPADEVTK